VFKVFINFNTFLVAPSSSRSLVVSFLAAAAAVAAALEVYLLVGRVVAGLCEKVTFRVSNGYLNLPIYLPMAQ
jgi:hypothetical protein